MAEPDISQMTEAQQRMFITTHLANPWWRLNNLYKVENEKGDLVTFKMRPAQESLFRGMHKRNIILKARQLGFSTAIDIYLLDQAMFNKNLKCAIVAQDLNAAGEIFRTKIEVPFNNLPAWLKSSFPVSSWRSSSQGGYILFSHGSSIQVATSFRSGTVQRLHISEHGKICAKYPAKARELRTGTLNAASSEDAIVFDESTAEGVGGDYYDMVQRAIELQQSGIELDALDFKFHFFPWFRDPKYATNPPTGGLYLSKYHEDYFDAVELQAGVKLSDAQKNWYVNKEIGQKSEMKQEFPSTPQEAFLTSGRRVFDAIDCMTAEAACSKPMLVYEVDPVTGARSKAQRFRDGDDKELIKTLLNFLLVWELPDPDGEYVIGADVAEGLEHGDRSSFDVANKITGEQVAHWYGHLDAELFAMLLAHVGKWYNTAYIMPERNNHGHAVLQKLRAVYPTTSIYSEQHLDRDRDDETPKLGWLTTAQSKPIVVEGAKTLLREGSSGLNWIGTVAELNTYVYDARGRMNAQEGCFDDQAMSWMLTQEAVARAPRKVKLQPLVRPKNQHWMTP